MSDIETDARNYWAIVDGPTNGWGQCCDPKTGQQSHWVLRDGFEKYGQDEFNAALDKVRNKKQ